MRENANNYAFIDGQNLNLSIQSLGWNLDFRRFRVYLKEKYNIARAFVFVGYVESNISVYEDLKRNGFICIFKPTIIYENLKIKGNCDAELGLHTMIKLNNFDKAAIVTGDGDFYCLVDYLLRKDKLQILLVPNELRFSTLFKEERFTPHIKYLNRRGNTLEYHKKERSP